MTITKLVLAFLSVAYFGIFVSGQTSNSKNQKPFLLEGSKVSSVQINEDKLYFYIKLVLDFSLTNNSDGKLIFWNQKEPIYLGNTLSKTRYFSNEDIIENSFGGPGIDTSEKWGVLRNSLDKEAPPQGITKILLPNERWNFSSEVTIVAVKSENKITKELYFDKLKELSQIWMKVYYEVWSQNLELSIDERSNLIFGKTLQQRWGKYGYLWLDDIVSEPIPLDLSCLAAKTPKN